MKHFKLLLAIIIFIASLWILDKYNFYLFHFITEFISIIIAYIIFAIGWNSREFTNNYKLMFIGIAYFVIGLFDFFHMLTFPGLDIFFNNNQYVTVSFWVFGRFIESISLLLSGYFLYKRKSININYVLLLYTIIPLLLTIFIFKFREGFSFYVKGQGLTSLKIVSEYIIIFTLIGAIFFYYHGLKKNKTSKKVIYLIIASIILTIFSEYCFTLYNELIGNSYIIFGHILKVLSFYLIYKALVVESLQKPYEILFKDYNQIQERLIATGSFASTMFHDLKNPLTTVRALGQLGGKITRGEKEKEYFNRIVNQVNNVSKMLNHSLDAFKPDELKLVNPVEPVIEVIEDVKPSCIEKNIQIKLDNKKNITGKVNLELKLFKRALHNLISNAIKAIDKNGKIVIRVKEKTNNFIFEVEDNGPGIPVHLKNDIFKPFKTGGEGTGLGLYMVHYTITKISKGKIWFKSHQGKGTTFYFKLPKQY